MSDKKATGKRGEQLAEAYLEEKGYKIVSRNYRYKRAEIDLIARRNTFLVFVEVKTRRSSAFGEPETFVNDAQAERVMEAAENYVFETGWQKNIRFDIIAVRLGKQFEVAHFEDAFG